MRITSRSKPWIYGAALAALAAALLWLAISFGWDEPESARAVEPAAAKVGVPKSRPLDVQGAQAGGPRLEALSEAYEKLPQAAGQTEGLAEPAWRLRFPEAVALQERVLSQQAGRRLLQTLLKTEQQDRPYVVWQERQTPTVEGEWLTRGVAAYVGDALLVETHGSELEDPVFKELLAELGLETQRLSLSSGFARLALSDPSLERLDAATKRLQDALPRRVVEWEALYFTAALPDDWRPDYAWGLEKILAPEAWQFATGSEEVVIAVLDTGLDLTHPDLVENLFINPGEIPNNGKDDDGNGFIDDVSGWDFHDDDNRPNDTSGHGTHVSGLAAARGNNGQGLAGVNWTVKILPLRVGNAASLDTGSIIEALDYVAALRATGVNVVVSNNSYGSESGSSLFRRAIERQRDAGILFVAAAGNEGMDLDSEAMSYPAGFATENIIAVANSNQEDRLSRQSNTGAISVDLAAPGTEVYSTFANGGYRFMTGTSMSSPLVAGAVALLASAEPTLSASQLKKRLLDTVDPIPSHTGRTVTGGRLNALAALRPSLKGHAIASPSHPRMIVAGVSPGLPVDFQIEALPGAELSARLETGLGNGVVEALGEGRFRFTAIENGAFWIRFTAVLEGVERSLERAVFAGPIDDPTAGLTHRFDFGGASAFSEPDLAGGSNGSYIEVQKVDSDYGRLARFPGQNGKMSFAGDFSNSVTIAALVKSENLLSSAHPRIVNMPFYYLYVSSDSGLNQIDGNSDTLKFLAEKDELAGVWNSPPRSVRQGDWMFVVGAYDSATPGSRPSLYLNGERLPVWVQQEPRGRQAAFPGSSYLGNNGDSDRAWAGLMGGVRIYDRELTDREIAQLGAAMAERKWGRFTIGAEDPLAIGATVRFRVRDFDAIAAQGAYEWRVMAGDDHEALASDQSEARFRFAGAGPYVIAAKVTDELSTRYFSYTVSPEAAEVKPGVFRGVTSGGGLVWLEVAGGSKSGRISLLDPESGFYRLDEPVAIDEQGRLFTEENSSGRIEGSLVDGLSGGAPGVGIAFTGSRLPPSSSSSAVAGRYGGGAIGSPGDGVNLEIAEDGSFLFRREGSRADLAFGWLEAPDTLVFTTAKGRSVTLQIDAETGTVSGTAQDEAGPRLLWLENVAHESPLGLRGGVVASAAPHAGQKGVFASFVGREEGLAPQLALGGLASPSARGVPSTAGFLVDARGRFRQFHDRDDQSILALLAEPLATSGLAVDDKPLRSLVAQVNVDSRGSALAAFAIDGDLPQETLIRGSAGSIVNSASFDPRLELFRLGEEGEWLLIGANDDWMEEAEFADGLSSAQGAFRSLETGFATLGLAPLARGSMEPALRVWLEPGVYAIRLLCRSGEEGEGLLELHELP